MDDYIFISKRLARLGREWFVSNPFYLDKYPDHWSMLTLWG